VEQQQQLPPETTEAIRYSAPLLQRVAVAAQALLLKTAKTAVLEAVEAVEELAAPEELATLQIQPHRKEITVGLDNQVRHTLAAVVEALEQLVKLAAVEVMAALERPHLFLVRPLHMLAVAVVMPLQAQEREALAVAGMELLQGTQAMERQTPVVAAAGR